MDPQTLALLQAQGGAAAGGAPATPAGQPPMGPNNPQSASLLNQILTFLAGAGLETTVRSISKVTGAGNKGMGNDPNRAHRPTGGPQGGGAQPPPAPSAVAGGPQGGGQIPPEMLQKLLMLLAMQRGQGAQGGAPQAS